MYRSSKIESGIDYRAAKNVKHRVLSVHCPRRRGVTVRRVGGGGPQQRVRQGHVGPPQPRHSPATGTFTVCFLDIRGLCIHMDGVNSNSAHFKVKQLSSRYFQVFYTQVKKYMMAY